jgi:hypothetical protein
LPARSHDILGQIFLSLANSQPADIEVIPELCALGVPLLILILVVAREVVAQDSYVSQMRLVCFFSPRGPSFSGLDVR